MGNWSAISSFKEILYIFRTKYIVWSSVPFSTELKDYNELFEFSGSTRMQFSSWKKGQFIESRPFFIYIKVVSRTGQNRIAVELPSKTDKELSFG